jgi:hypothetical protein
MAKTGKTNLSSYSIENTAITKGGYCSNEYSSAKVLSKATAGKDQGRAPGYLIEKLKK